MALDISEIRLMRRKMGLTQSELAKSSGVSQSLIAKIESGSIDPSFSKAKKIFSFLESAREKQELKAGDIMRNSIISVKPDSQLKDAIEKMKKHSISQIPVMSGGKCMGVVSETSILDSLIHGKAEKVRDVMADCPPIIPKSSSIKVVSELLRFSPIVMVSGKGIIIGVITKSDIIGRLKDF